MRREITRSAIIEEILETKFHIAPKFRYIIVAIHDNDYDNNGKKTEKYKYEYDEYGNITSAISLDKNGKIIITPNIAEAIEISNEIAPEHLELCLDNPFDYLDEIQHAGSIFMGKNCPEALGDYFAGPNHTLPTSGTAKFSSPLSVDDFVKKTQYTYFTKDALSAVADDVAYFAEKEGLSAHARSAVSRKNLK